jgi:hypothetical protein
MSLAQLSPSLLSLFGMLASVKGNLFKIFLKPDNDCHKSQFINSTKNGKVEILGPETDP